MLVCVDGTGASSTAEYAHIFAHSFVNRVKHEYLRAHPAPYPAPIHHRGPGADLSDGAFGSLGGSHHVAPRFVFDELMAQRASLCEVEDVDMISSPGPRIDICRPRDESAGFADPRLKIFLVGHSRGGGIVIDVAQLLLRHHVEVEAMFLFDAVDRSSELYGGDIPANVRHCYHAMRDPAGLSRPSFGNCGTSAAPGVDFQPRPMRLFMTTHGAMGGTPWGRNPEHLTTYGTIREDDPTGLGTSLTVISPDMEERGMREVEQWMWPHLRRHGVVP